MKDIKETIEFRLEKIDLRLKESIPNTIMVFSLIVCLMLSCIFYNFVTSFFFALMIIFISIILNKKEKKKFMDLFNKYYKLEIKNRK